MAVSLELRAAAELEIRRRERAGLLGFVPRISPKLSEPAHLSPIIDVFERALTEPVFALVSVPPQFGKTETILHGLAWTMRKHPADSYAYVSYIASVAEDKSIKCRGYAERAGVDVDRNQSAASHWATKQGGDFFATGIGGPLTSKPVSRILVVDDPFKNREECESLRERDRVEEWFDSTATARCHPSTSVLVVHTRWHEDDLIARLAKRRGLDGKSDRFEVINLAAIDAETGEPLWPEGRPVDFLQQRRLDIKEHNWWSLYMGSPRPRGGELFKGVQFYDTLPNRYRIGKGLDLGYTGTTRSDASVAVVLAECNGDIFIVDVEWAQSDVPSFVPKLQALDRKYPGSWNFLCSSLEAKAIELAGHVLKGVSINSIPTTSDKWVRAQPVAGAWNGVVDEDGKTILSKPRVFLPRNAPWVAPFLEEVGKFTGVGDRADDRVDSLAAAFFDFKDIGAGTRIYVPKRRSAAGYRHTGRGY